LRNPDERGLRRPPLLLLVPPGTELLGSLDADTFNVLSCDDVVRDVVNQRLAALPTELAAVAELMRDRRRGWSDVQRARYLLAVAGNGNTPEAAGLALCVLGLWPHRTWIATADQREYWLTRNAALADSLSGG